MVKSGSLMDAFTYTAILNACQRANEAQVALEVFRYSPPQPLRHPLKSCRHYANSTLLLAAWLLWTLAVLLCCAHPAAACCISCCVTWAACQDLIFCQKFVSLLCCVLQGLLITSATSTCQHKSKAHLTCCCCGCTRQQGAQTHDTISSFIVLCQI